MGGPSLPRLLLGGDGVDQGEVSAQGKQGQGECGGGKEGRGGGGGGEGGTGLQTNHCSLSGTGASV